MARHPPAEEGSDVRRVSPHGQFRATRIEGRLVTEVVKRLVPDADANDVEAIGAWTIDESVELARVLGKRGVDLIDVSSGGTSPNATIPVGPGYQVSFAERIRYEAGIPTGAVGMLNDAQQVEEIIAGGKADRAFIAREFLRDPYWPLHAAHTRWEPTSRG